MRTVKLLGAGAVAVLVLVACSTTSAWASGKVLVLKRGGSPVAAGAPVYIFFNVGLGECSNIGEGSIVKTDASVDLLQFVSDFAAYPCLGDGESDMIESGLGVAAMKPSVSGKATLKIEWEIVTFPPKPGGGYQECKYALAKSAVVHFTPGGALNGTGTVAVKDLSRPPCPRVTSTHIYATEVRGQEVSGRLVGPEARALETEVQARTHN